MWRICIDGGTTTAILERTTRMAPGLATFVCAHGAGGHMADRSMTNLAAVFRDRGMDVVRFNFPYREKGAGPPDPMPRLEACVEAVIARVREEMRTPLLIAGGRSMGGRVASMLAAEGARWDGLLLLAYPLHPAGKPEQLRDAHLRRIAMPVLCLNGTRDALCRRDLMERVLRSVEARWQMHWLEGADHSFHVLKSSGSTDENVLSEVGSVSERWLHELG